MPGEELPLFPAVCCGWDRWSRRRETVATSKPHRDQRSRPQQNGGIDGSATTTHRHSGERGRQRARVRALPGFA